jgi:ABC-type molybdate transport system permease subunit
VLTVTGILVLSIGLCIAIEFALDRTRLSHILLYVIMAAAVAAPVVFGYVLLRRNDFREGQNLT